MTMKTTHAYIGINKFGSVRAVVLDDPGEEEHTGELIKSWVLMGRTVERVTVEEMKLRLNPKPSEEVVREMRDEWK